MYAELQRYKRELARHALVSAPAALQLPDRLSGQGGRAAPRTGFRARVDAIVLRHAPRSTPGAVTERPSANGNFLSITYLLRAESRAQIEALVAELERLRGRHDAALAFRGL